MRPNPRLETILSDMAIEAVAEAELAHGPQDLASAAPLWRERFTPWIAVSLGGLLGAPARYFAGKWAMDHWGSGFPWGTLLINLTGSFVLGFYLTLITERFSGRSSTRLFFATGFLGAYTTFSTFSYETVHFIQNGHVARAMVYAGVSLIGGLIAVVLGVEAAAQL